MKGGFLSLKREGAKCGTIVEAVLRTAINPYLCGADKAGETWRRKTKAKDT